MMKLSYILIGSQRACSQPVTSLPHFVVIVVDVVIVVIVVIGVYGVNGVMARLQIEAKFFRMS